MTSELVGFAPATSLVGMMFCMVFVGCLGLFGCGGPTGNRAEAPEPTVVPNPGSVDESLEIATEWNGAELQSVKPRSDRDPVAASLKVPRNTFSAGDTFEVSIVLDVAPFYEIDDEHAPPPAVATRLELKLPAGFQAVGDWSLPESTDSDTPDGRAVYVGAVAFTRGVNIENDVKPGKYYLICAIRYQACNARRCLRPVNCKLRVVVSVQR